MPEAGRPVVVNATPIIGLALIDQLPLLQSLYREVLIPEAVRSEVMTGGARRVGVVQLEGATWIRTVALRDPGRADLLSDLDRGEAEVIALAQELTASLVIIDERLARRHARRLGLPLTGTLGVLLRAKERGLIPRVAPFIHGLRAGGVRLSAGLVRRALQLAGEAEGASAGSA
jgi:predicted nucleic acid-binding protein